MKKRTVLSTFTLIVLLAGLVSGVLQSLIVPHQAGAAPGDEPVGEAWVARYSGAVLGDDSAIDVAVDGSGNIFVTGQTNNGAMTTMPRLNTILGKSVVAATYNGRQALATSLALWL